MKTIHRFNLQLIDTVTLPEMLLVASIIFPFERSDNVYLKRMHVCATRFDSPTNRFVVPCQGFLTDNLSGDWAAFTGFKVVTPQGTATLVTQLQITCNHFNDWEGELLLSKPNESLFAFVSIDTTGLVAAENIFSTFEFEIETRTFESVH